MCTTTDLSMALYHKDALSGSKRWYIVWVDVRLEFFFNVSGINIAVLIHLTASVLFSLPIDHCCLSPWLLSSSAWMDSYQSKGFTPPPSPPPSQPPPPHTYSPHPTFSPPSLSHVNLQILVHSKTPLLPFQWALTLAQWRPLRSHMSSYFPHTNAAARTKTSARISPWLDDYDARPTLMKDATWSDLSLQLHVSLYYH